MSYETKIASSMDRFEEAHFYIHAMESFYHKADPFRWSLNSFLRALKEVPKLIEMELQNESGFPKWYRVRRDELHMDPLIGHLSKQRDFVVHRGMLKPASLAAIGVTEGRGLKMGLSVSIEPLQDSDNAMLWYLRAAMHKGDGLGLLAPDEDSVPCVERYWRLREFDEELIDLTSRAWLRVGELVSEVVRWLGGEPPPLSLSCRHSGQRVRIKTYDRRLLRDLLAQACHHKGP